MMTSFEEFVGALFKDIFPISNFDIIRICKKLEKIISQVVPCAMKLVIYAAATSVLY